MDYGKLAYLKTEELEQRMSARAEENSEGGVRRAFYPKYNFAAGAYLFTSLSAGGIVAMVLKLKLRREADVRGSIQLRVSGFCAALQDISGKVGEQEYLVLASVSVSGAAEIILEPTSNFAVTLLSVELVCIGGGAVLSGGLNNWNADYLGNTGVVALTRDEQIYVAKISDNAVGDICNAGRGHIVDIAAVADGFSLVFCDDLNNCWGVRLDTNLVEKSRRFLGAAAQAVTVASLDDRLIIAFLNNGKVVSRSCDVDFGGLSLGTQLDVGVAADDIRFVKQASSPMLTVASGGVVYLKLAAEEVGAADTFSITSKFTYLKV